MVLRRPHSILLQRLGTEALSSIRLPSISISRQSWFTRRSSSISKSSRFKDVLVSDVENQTKAGRERVFDVLSPLFLQNFKNYGIQVYELTDKERESFSGVAKEVRAVFEKSASKRGLDLLKSIEKVESQVSQQIETPHPHAPYWRSLVKRRFTLMGESLAGH